MTFGSENPVVCSNRFPADSAALILLLIFAYLGNILLVLLGVTLADFEIAGGAL